MKARRARLIVTAGMFLFAFSPGRAVGQENGQAPAIRTVAVSDGVELHYVEQGKGEPGVFVHGSLSDGSYWNDQASAFATSGYRAIAYSRRYNPPNTNKAQPGYSAVVDADDLAALIK